MLNYFSIMLIFLPIHLADEAIWASPNAKLGSFCVHVHIFFKHDVVSIHICFLNTAPYFFGRHDMNSMDTMVSVPWIPLA